MPDKITYYAVVADDRTIDNPYGLVRRLEHDDGTSDEGLRKDFSWAYTPAIVEWERGDLGPELVEVSHEQASRIVEYFRQKWGPSDSRLTRCGGRYAEPDNKHVIVSLA